MGTPLLVIVCLLTALAFLCKELAKIVAKEEYSYWGPKLAKKLIGLSGKISRSRRLEMNEHLETLQRDDKVAGVIFALDVLLRSPLVAISDFRRHLRAWLSLRRLRIRAGRQERYGRAVSSVANRADRVVDFLLRLGYINTYALIGAAFVLTTTAGLLVLVDRTIVSAFSLSLAGLCEALDWRAARRSSHPRAAILFDYLADRLGEIVLFGCLAASYWHEDRLLSVVFVSTLVAAQLGSYVRAGASLLGLHLTVSPFVARWRFAAPIGGLWSTALMPDSSSSMRVCAAIAFLATLWFLLRRISEMLYDPHLDASVVWSDIRR